MQDENIGLCFMLTVLLTLLLLNSPGIVHNFEAYVSHGKIVVSPWAYASSLVLIYLLWTIYDRYYRYDEDNSYENFLRWKDESRDKTKKC